MLLFIISSTQFNDSAVSVKTQIKFIHPIVYRMIHKINLTLLSIAGKFVLLQDMQFVFNI